jgi:F0F1-type ATP synthase assembly protein I
MKPEKQPPATTYVLAAGVAGQVGCFLILVIGLALVAGMGLDRLVGTRSTFLLLFLLGSIPLNLFLIYRYALHKTKQLQSSPKQKEDTTRDV